jgi:hypothetical protein
MYKTLQILKVTDIWGVKQLQFISDKILPVHQLQSALLSGHSFFLGYGGHITTLEYSIQLSEYY